MRSFTFLAASTPTFFTGSLFSRGRWGSDLHNIPAIKENKRSSLVHMQESLRKQPHLEPNLPRRGGFQTSLSLFNVVCSQDKF